MPVKSSVALLLGRLVFNRLPQPAKTGTGRVPKEKFQTLIFDPCFIELGYVFFGRDLEVDPEPFFPKSFLVNCELSNWFQ